MAKKPTLRQQIRRARRRYIGNPSNEHLRWYLNAKGRLGRWDHRMHAYTGVDTNVTAEVRRFIARGYAAGLVPTSTTGGQHAPGSYHPQHRAADLGVRGPEVGTAKATRKMQRFQRREFKRGGHTELIGPDNYCIILRGARTTLPEGNALENQHDNHVHGAY